MSYEVTIKGDTLAHLALNIVRLAEQFGTTPVETGRGANPAPKAPEETAAPKEAKETTVSKDDDKTEISYAKDIAPRVLKLAEVSRQSAIDVLAEFGVTKAPQLKAEQYAAFVKAVDAKLAE